MITLSGVRKQYGSQVVFDNMSASFFEKDRVALIGKNGTGKTTLLRLINGTEEPDGGEVSVPAGSTIGYLPQEIETLRDASPLDIVLEPFSHLMDCEKVFERVSDSCAADDRSHYKKALTAMDALQAQMEFHDAFSLASRAKSILAGLGVPSDKWESPVQELSGGYRMRVMLARLLLLSPDTLLLDEPTNHLDMDSLVWLEKFLERYRGGLIIVSHDRDFLNRATTCTAEIEMGGITVYKGVFDAYMDYKEECERSAQSTLQNLQRQIAQKERFIERFRAKATKASQVQSRIKSVEDLKEQLPDIPQAGRTMHFTFPSPRQSGGVPYKIENVTVEYDGVPVFTNLNFTVTRGDKIAVVGPNGAGKTTLLKLLVGLVTPAVGTVTVGHNVDARYFGQHQLEQLDCERTLYETVAQASSSGERTFIRNMLGAFLFSGDDVEKKVRVLSGGETSRLVLATMLSRPGNMLILDEPTNHLDMQSVEVLTGALAGFAGTLLFVSHNEYFISRIANRVIEMRPGVFKDFPGTIADYRSYLEAGYMGGQEAGGVSAGRGREAADEAAEKQERIRRKEERKRLQRRIEKLENEIAKNEESLKAADTVCNDPVNASNFSLLHDTMRDMETLKRENEALVAEWEDLHVQFSEVEDA
jgi:ATP-binding cassette subfamily F protein 3